MANTEGVTMRLPEIRGELPEDYSAIHAVTEFAFRGMPFADGDEPEVIDRLRSTGALALSLVAIIDQQVVGHIAFSTATIADNTHPWFALGPVSVSPELQRQGIGSALIESGMAEIENRGALGCILTGNPGYYRRFGFELAPQNVPTSEPEEFFMLKRLTPICPVGTFRFDQAFYGDA